MSSTNGGGRELEREAVLFDLAKRAASTSLVADVAQRLDVAERDEHHVVDDLDDDEDVAQ